MKKYQDLAILLLRVATAANFLSPVASRLGIWVGPGSGWDAFVAYTAQVNSFAPPQIVPWLAVIATVLETVFALMILAGWMTRWAALGAAGLTFIFALTMAYSFGIKEPLNYAVFVDCTSAFLLATMPAYRWSIDQLQGRE